MKHRDSAELIVQPFQQAELQWDDWKCMAWK